MAYIIMGRDECGDEFRPNSIDYDTPEAANKDLAEERENYPEARSMWVEELRDADYYMRQMWQDDLYDERDLY